MNLEKKQLLDKKGTIVSQMEASFAEVRKREDKTPTKEENQKFDGWDGELQQIQERIDFIEREDRVKTMKIVREGNEDESRQETEKKFAASTVATPEKRGDVFAKAKKVGFSSLDDEERSVYNVIERDSDVYRRWLKDGMESLSVEDRKIMYSRKETRVGAGQSTTDAAGGYTIPEGFAGRIIENMTFISQILNWANLFPTATGNDIPFPINDDTANTGELIGEASDISTATADLVFTAYVLKAYKFSSKMIKVSSEILQDNGVNLEQYLGKKLAQRVARITNTYFTTGAGSNQPQGYITGGSQGYVTAATTTFTSAELITFQDTLDQAYQNMPKTAWAMHQQVLTAIKKLTIGANYNSQLWVPSFRDGAPDTILGKPYFLNNAMSSTTATGTKPIAYGDWDNFTIRRVNDFSLRRLTERYAEFDQVAFFGLARMDSFVENSAAIKYLEIS